LILYEIIYLIVPLIVFSTLQLGSTKPRWVGCIGTSSPKHIANKNINKIFMLNGIIEGCIQTKEMQALILSS